ncbi:CYTH and CHAD domain-containing protein [Mycetocola sp. 2940]|uniref:CYTH and CHAD domain-containing protein n=1 Tax=Mycetocola sp. 2940 TaxID=3156452 RepID=UPI00339914AE
MTNIAEAGHHSQSEIERKYDVEEGASVPDLNAVDGIAAVEIRKPVKLEAVYYDTENLDLAVRRIIVRRRTGGGDAGWHIKKPAAEGRTELHWPLGDDTGTVPDAILEPIRAWVRDRDLTPLARIATRRTALHLLDADGNGVVEIADDEVTATDVRNGGKRSWREWEVELLGAAPDTEEGRTALLDQIEGLLAPVGAHPSSSVAKIARALGADSLTEVLPEARLVHDMTEDAAGDAAGGAASVVLVAAIGDLVNALEQTDPAARADEPDAVHRMRTIVRRLRSVLAAYRSLFDRKVTDDLRDRLGRIGSALGDARDLEVRALRAEALLDELGQPETDARERLVDGARELYAKAHAHLCTVLSSPEYYRLLDDLDAFVADPPLTDAGAKSAKKVVKKVLARELRRVQKRADAVEKASGDDLESRLHEVRKAGRRLRYAAEAAEAAGVGRSASVAAAGERLQDTLGEHRDCVLFGGHLSRTADRAEAAGEKTAVYAALAELSTRSGTAALAESTRALADVRRLR